MQKVRGAALAVVCSVAVLTAACGGGDGATAETLPPATSAGSSASSSATSSSATASSAAETSPATATVQSDGSASTSLAASTSSTAERVSVQEAQDRAAVEAQWVASWDVYLSVSRAPADQREALVDAVAVDPARANMLGDAQKFNDQGLETYGQLGHRISWPQAIDGQSTALIDDCQDRSQAGSQRTSTGDKVTVGVARDHYQGRLVRGDDGVWRVEQVFYLADEPC